MAVTRQVADCMERIRCPAIERLPRDTVILLHNSLVHIVRLRRGIEVTDRQAARKGSRLTIPYFYWQSCADTSSRSAPVPWDLCCLISAISRFQNDDMARAAH
jgi:hypothetical protein